jgi:succinyl-CoA synthetase beta subunit
MRRRPQLFTDADCTMVEVNPLAEDDTGLLIAADAKIGFDDNASFRQARWPPAPVLRRPPNGAAPAER